MPLKNHANHGFVSKPKDKVDSKSKPLPPEELPRNKTIFKYITMSNLISGAQIMLSDGSTATVKSKLGEGGQGVVYLVTLSNGTDMALKCYLNKPEAAFMKNLKDLISQKPPSPAFLWPKYIASIDGEECGYVMALKPKTYFELGDFYSAGFDGKVKANFASFEARIQAAIHVCNAFRQLHIQGLSYQDVNDGGFLINPGDGEVLICDCDNVCPNNTSISHILGKTRYMAPEVIEGNYPNTDSDRLSLAIILYRLFMLDHPFEGERIIKIPCLTQEIERLKYGREAVFVYDAFDNSNRPNSRIHSNSTLFWKYCPPSLQKMFQKALGHEAIVNPTNRVSAKDWKELFLELRRNLIVCPKSPEGKDHDFMADNPVQQCLRCGDHIVIDTTLYFSDGSKYIVTPHKHIYISDEMNPIAFGVSRVNNSGEIELGIRNTSNSTWNVQTPTGNIRQVEPGKSMPLLNSMQIRFRGNMACKVVVNNSH